MPCTYGISPKVADEDQCGNTINVQLGSKITHNWRCDSGKRTLAQVGVSIHYPLDHYDSLIDEMLMNFQISRPLRHISVNAGPQLFREGLEERTGTHDSRRQRVSSHSLCALTRFPDAHWNLGS